ncbi:MAG: CDP-alcohol phosphatidyltransferase family protein [Myxococcota bacterium]
MTSTHARDRTTSGRDAPGAPTPLRPGAERESGPSASASASASAVAAPRWAWILEPRTDSGARDSGARVWGLDGVERLRRILDRAGVPNVRSLPAEAPPPDRVDGPCAVLRGDQFYDERLVKGLLGGGPETVLAREAPGEGGGDWLAARISGDRIGEVTELLRACEVNGASPLSEDLEPALPVDVAPAYNPELRKFDPPFVFPARSDAVLESENRIFKASYKGLTDLVTKWVWPIPAREMVRVCARQGVSANSITTLSWLMAALTVLLFVEGWFGLGLACGWMMTFLDTVDGKLARCTLTSSRLGHFFDHGLDLIHPPIWWVAFGIGLAPTWPGVEWVSGVIVVCYLVGRLLEGIFMLAFDMEIFLWRPFDGFFRQIISRRNPNLLLLTAGLLAGRPDVGFLAVAVWGVLSNAVHAVRLVQAFAQRRRGEPVRAWYEVQEAA